MCVYTLVCIWRLIAGCECGINCNLIAAFHWNALLLLLPATNLITGCVNNSLERQAQPEKSQVTQTSHAACDITSPLRLVTVQRRVGWLGAFYKCVYVINLYFSSHSKWAADTNLFFTFNFLSAANLRAIVFCHSIRATAIVQIRGQTVAAYPQPDIEKTVCLTINYNKLWHLFLLEISTLHQASRIRFSSA